MATLELNMRNFRIIIIAFISAGVVFSSGLIYGFKEGVKNYSILEAVVQGALSRHQLAAIDKNNVGSVAHLFELSIDNGLHSYAIYQSEGNKLLSKYFLPTHIQGLEGYVDLMAEYRENHPIVYNSDWATDNPAEHSESEKMLNLIKSTLKDRGVSEVALTKLSN